MWKMERTSEEERQPYPRERQARWDSEHMKTVSTRLTVEEYRAFRTLCRQERRTMYSVLRVLIKQWALEIAKRNSAADVGRR